jgi:hypothetical protein
MIDPCLTSSTHRAEVDRRRYPRGQAKLEIELKVDGPGAPRRTHTTDVGLGGCYVEMMFTLAVGSCVDLTLWLGEEKWRSRAEVVTRDPQFGNGFRFLDLDSERRSRLGRFLDALPGEELEANLNRDLLTVRTTQNLPAYRLIISLLFFALPRAKADGQPGLPQDWSHRYVGFTNGGSARAAVAAQAEFRTYSNWLARTRRRQDEMRREPSDGDDRRKRRPVRRVDWSVSLGGGGQAANMYPAEFTYDVNAVPDCVNDFIVYTIDANGSVAQANIVALNYLYSGTTPNGICNNLAGNGASAKVMWAYNTGNNSNNPSPVLSLDGKKVAFIQNSNPAKFQVLAWTAGQGSVTAPATPTGAQMTSLTLTGATSDATSSPFIDYTNDIAYVGTDNGWVFKITGVFSGTPALAGAPWPVRAGNTNLTGPIYDAVSGNLFVGSRDGHLYGFAPNGTALANSPLIVGNGAADGDIADPPLVDSFNGFVYVFTGDNGSNAVAVQASTTTLAPVRQAVIGSRNQTHIHAGTVNDAYFSQVTNSVGTNQEWFLYVCGVAMAGKIPVLYRLGFDSNRNMNMTVDGTSVSLSAINNEECSPLTDFFNGTDRIFLSLRATQRVEYFDVSTTTSATLSATQVSEAGCTSGIVVDNVSGQPQASSIYFGTLSNDASCGGKRCAVKLTQSALQ